MKVYASGGGFRLLGKDMEPRSILEEVVTLGFRTPFPSELFETAYLTKLKLDALAYCCK